MKKRNCGILVHPTSLPGNYGIGTLGIEAYNFVDFLIEADQKIWQILPLGPTGFGDSPYQCFSAFAGNTLLIDPEKLYHEGLIPVIDLENNNGSDATIINFEKVREYNDFLLHKAYKTFIDNHDDGNKYKFERFCRNNNYWLDDFALFMAIKNANDGKPWYEWSDELKLRNNDALLRVRNELCDEIDYHKFVQYLFFKQWFELKSYCNFNGIEIIGDIPIYVSFDSSDVWAYPDIFMLDENKMPEKVSGVPPDYFSETGQLWGNPLYDWETLQENSYDWWIERFEMNMKMFDKVRIDHFRGFAAFWAIPYGEETAVNGEWMQGPGKKFFIAIEHHFGKLPVIAEDLGVITPDVENLRDSSGFPGMKILQFAFDSNEANDYLPHTYNKNFVVYTGTHDNNTTAGWYESIENQDDKSFLHEYLNIENANICQALIRTAWSSVADTAITTVQDLLELDSEARMNFPGKDSGYWKWRFQKGKLTSEMALKLKKLTRLYDR